MILCEANIVKILNWKKTTFVQIVQIAMFLQFCAKEMIGEWCVKS